MPLVTANGLRFHVQRLGTPTAGRTVVMLHGLLVGSLASWYFTAAPALARDHEVLLYDLRGHGRSDHAAAGYDVATMATDLAALTADLRGPLALVGHSWGALIALRFTLDHPGRVDRLALVEAPLPPSDFAELGVFASLPPEEMAAALPAAARALVGGDGRRARRFVAGLTRLIGESTLLADLAAEPDIADAELARVACPVLCAYGRASACRPAGERLARVIPGAALALFDGGHYLPLDAGPALAARLAEHLDG